LGFLNATCELGNLNNIGSRDPDFKDIDKFLRLPLQIIEDETRSGRVIRVWLNVKDINEESLHVKGIEKIDSTDFIRNFDEEKIQQEKRKYIFREPTGSATPWKFSPIYKLGKGASDAKKELLGENGSWQEDRNSRFYKLHRSVLSDFETCKVFHIGSVDRIMEELERNIDRLGELWSDKKRSYLLVFGVNNNGNFFYPGQIPVFRSYFKSKLSGNLGGDVRVVCGLCNSNSEAGANLDKVFKFATFDKSSFLPGTRDGKGVSEKVFPICEDCLSSLSLGREILDRSFLDGRTLPGVKIYVVPELLISQENLGTASKETKDFIRTGLHTSERFFNILAKQENSLVYHFLFWEQNQSQERLHLMVEDVPPSRLKHLEKLWIDSYKTFLWNQAKEPDFDPNSTTLDKALKTIYYVFTSLSGKSDADKAIMKERMIGVTGQLLDNETINIKGIKKLMISRFPGLFSDPEWLKNGAYELRKMATVIDFIIKANRR